MRLLRFLLLSFVLILFIQIAQAQTGGYGDLLYKEVEVENPVYMPVMGFGVGYINYYGELQNDFKNLIQGKPTYRVNIYQFLDKKHNLKVNMNMMLGKITGSERSYTDTSMNANFESDLLALGVNLEYSFGNIYKGERKIVPFISIGAEYITKMNQKIDFFYDKNGIKGEYIYMPDGSIRVDDRIVTRDYNYESNLKDLNPYGRPNADYDQESYAIVADIGFDFKISNRVALRLASSLHYTFTDDIDGVSSENTTNRIGDSKNDMFSFTYVSMNVDLFSSPKTISQDLLFADVEFDPVAFSDTDRDRILDLADDCPDTPKGVVVDSVGCPLDGDKDGVPDYIDKEQFTPPGVIVDEFGAKYPENKIRETLYQDLQAVSRQELYMIPIGMGWSKYDSMSSVEIPEKYKKLDVDGDNYISFDELLDAINGFFDFDSEFNTDDIYDLNNFFFAQ